MMRQTERHQPEPKDERVAMRVIQVPMSETLWPLKNSL